MINIPKHVAIIMDGNGRWAEKRSLPRTAGHVEGAKVLKTLLPAAKKKGIEYLTLYAFSTENWKRPPEEVQTLMNLFRQYLKEDISALAKENVRIRFIGDSTAFDEDIQKMMNDLIKQTENNTGCCLILALNYGGRDEMIRAINKIIKNGLTFVDENSLMNALDTASIPDVDLMIRTSGEYRLSNFLPLQSGYAELYFTDVLWPDFNEKELDRAIEWYSKRNRRFGSLKKENINDKK